MSADRIQLQPGDHLRPGACVMGDVCIFTLETDTRAEVSLVLYRKGKKEPLRILPLDGSFRKGCSYSARVWPLDPEKMEYNYLIDGKVCQDPCARLITGRSHQIRVQFSSRGYPLVNDQRYHPHPRKGQIALYAVSLRLVHPVTRETITVTAEPPHTWPWKEFEVLK